MASVEIKLKLNVDLDIKAEREDIPRLTESVKEQIQAAIAPTALVANGRNYKNPVEQLPSPADVLPTQVREKSQRPRRTVRGSEKTPPIKVEAIDWIHDPSKSGTPHSIMVHCR